MNKQRGFSLIELLIVLAIILIIAAMSIPGFLRARISANESSAVSVARQINTAGGTYASSWGSGLRSGLGKSWLPCLGTAATACLLDPLLSTGTFTKSGYTFNAAGTLLVGTVYNGFEVAAWPNTVQTTGVRGFCDDQTGVLKFVSPSPATMPVAPGSCAGVATVAGVCGAVGN